MYNKKNYLKEKERYKTDKSFRLRKKLRWRITRAVREYLRYGKLRKPDEYGVDYAAIVKFLGPCPGVRKDYHIDHITPLRAFDLRKKKQLLKALAPDNHQWLLVKDNLSKGGKII